MFKARSHLLQPNILLFAYSSPLPFVRFKLIPSIAIFQLNVSLLAFTYNTPEPQMAHACINHLWLPCSRAVAQTIVRSAEMRTTFDCFSRDLYIGLAGIITFFRRDNSWINIRRTTGFHLIGALIQVRYVPVAGPFPYVACHVIQPITIGCE